VRRFMRKNVKRWKKSKVKISEVVNQTWSQHHELERGTGKNFTGMDLNQKEAKLFKKQRSQLKNELHARTEPVGDRYGGSPRFI
jgi:hypothetical protein